MRFPRIHRSLRIPVIVLVAACMQTIDVSEGRCQTADSAEIRIDFHAPQYRISAGIYGQFIEHIGRCIDGGICEEGSAGTDSNGFRLDVLGDVRALHPALLRFPGGTVTKIYHWQDGVGRKELRPARPNLIWGGVNSNHFGTDECIRYARLIGAEPFLVVNMATGTAEEAAKWVEYCNGRNDTELAVLRRTNGSPAPHQVRYWGLGNEEYAMEDAGTLQDPARYAETAWHFAKLMKLQDPSIKLIVVGKGTKEWDLPVLTSLGPIADYLSIHHYAGSLPGKPWSVFESVAEFEHQVQQLDTLLAAFPDSVKDFSRWYRFPPRQSPIKLAIDEWGIWDQGGAGVYGLEQSYTWRHALAVASYLNIFQRHANVIGMAAWAQTVNVLAPIMTQGDAELRQTVYYPLKYYRELCGSVAVHTTVRSPNAGHASVPAIDVSCTTDSIGSTLVLCIVNRDEVRAIPCTVRIEGATTGEVHDGVMMTADSPDARVTFENAAHAPLHIHNLHGKDVPSVFPPASVTILRYALK